MTGRILPAIAIVAAVVIFFGYANPVWTGSVADLRASIAADEEAISSATDYLTQQNKLAAARDAIDPDDLAALDTFLPDSANNIGLILDLNALAGRSGLAIINMDIASDAVFGDSSKPTDVTVLPTDEATVSSVDLSVSASGTFEAFQSFLAGIEQSVRLLDVQDLSIEGSDSGIYHYQMRVRLYWLR